MTQGDDPKGRPGQPRNPTRWLLAAALLCASLGAQALQISSLSPQGEVAQVRQLRAKFDEAAVNFGDPKAPAPLTVTCDRADQGTGQGRWTSEREWVFDFSQDLPPGLRCSVTPVAGFQSPKGQALVAAASYRFNTSGPFVQQIQPSTYQEIEEDQYFLLKLNGPAAPASVTAHAWCHLDGVGERVPVRLIEGKERADLLLAARWTRPAEREPLRYVALACQRRLTAGSQVEIVWGQGISTPDTASGPGVANRVEKRWAFKVRQPFSVSFSCERENAQAACMPIRPLNLSFNSPVPRKLAAAVLLKSASASYKAQFDKEDTADDALVSNLHFAAPLPESTAFTLELPPGLVDASGRSPGNAASFPLKVSTGPMPPLLKFAASPFGVLERFADGPGNPPLLPVTVRQIEANLAAQVLKAGAQVKDLKAQDDRDIIQWYRRVQAASLVKVESRETALLADQKLALQTLDLPSVAPGQTRPFEVVGIPLTPGFHVVEIGSDRLGQALLDEKLGPKRRMYVRTSALVTNLGVHFKLGRENSLVWVTTLDRGQPVAGASVRVSDCSGKLVAQGETNAQGLATFAGLSPRPPGCASEVKSGDEDHEPDASSDSYFVSARATGADGVPDMSFVWSDWNRGIESWRFNLPTSQDPTPDLRAHTVLDRSLLRAGETVSMKHYLRSETTAGFALPSTQPKQLVITHVGSGQQYTQDLSWRQTATGGLSAQSTFQIPPAAKLGEYQIELVGDGGNRLGTVSFRVEEFRLPVFEGHIAPLDKKPLVHVTSVPSEVQLNYLSGGPAQNLPVRVSAVLRPHAISLPDYDDFSFRPPQKRKPGEASNEAPDEADNNASSDQRVVADKLPLLLDRQGTGKLTLDKLPLSAQAQDLLLEASYADPNGEIQTLQSQTTLWPAAVISGIRAESWVSSGQQLHFRALALSLAGKAQADAKLSVKAVAHITTSSRRRLVGGFYSYDNHSETRDLGEVCSGKSDAHGLLLCETRLEQTGEVELIATATDAQGNSVQSSARVWVTRQGELWFGGENSDRIDLLPEQKSYQPGDTARFQVRMPFRFATALVTVEREGILSSQVVQLNGQDPTVSLKVEDSWGPNVYISVLALRGRLREVPWYSFFTWGYKAPREWWTSFWYEGREYVAPTALVDLSKPAYRLGVASIRVGNQAHQLDVKVAADRESYPVRGQAQVTVSVKLPNGQPAANAEVALAAVDQALLELMPNRSWNLLDAMLQWRPWGVENSTAQMEIIGRRHFGRKAAPPGGGGGHGATRELLDTLLLWNPQLQLDANGQARVTVPLNDALTTFKIVAVADAQTGLFGTGSTSIRATQDLQIISGLPPLVREEDQFRAQITLRNTTAQPMKVEASARATLLDLKPLTIDIPAGEARELAWNVTAPAQLGQTRAGAILWEISARDTISGARDALKVSQRIIPAVPVTVQQATLVQLGAPFSLDVAAPADALPGRGGLSLALQPRLAEGLPGVRDWLARYPFICLEQKTSKSLGLRDAKMWQGVLAQLPSYLDGDGLANYFPPSNGESNHGSDILTSYVLAATHEAASLDPAFALSPSALEPMQRGLIAFVEGRIQRNFWSPRKDLDMRKIAALEALSRYGKAQGRMLGSIAIAPNQWPTSTVIDWYNVLQRVHDVPERDKRLAEAAQILKSRLSYQGTKLIFSTEKDDYWWWLMVNSDVNTARLLLAVLDDPAWKDDLGRLASGFIGRQQRGAWLTTTANLWGGLALEKFSAKFESAPVTGTTRAALGSHSASVDWSRVERVKTSDASGAAHQSTLFGAPASPGNLRNNSMSLPWDTGTLSVTQQGSGKPWLTLQSLAAVPLKAPFAAGYQLSRSVTPVEQAQAGHYSRGDVLRITLTVNASADMSWVVITDPVPAGATILGSGLGRDSAIASSGEKQSGEAWPAFEERSFESFRRYYEYMPKGTMSMEYTVRLNNVGDFALPPSRVEALYAPEMFGELPNARLKVEAAAR